MEPRPIARTYGDLLLTSDGDSFWSYRLAKFDVVSERRGLGRLALAEFEQSLRMNLGLLDLAMEDPTKLFRGVPPGKIWLRPKGIEREDQDLDNGSYFRVPERPHDHQIASMSVRVLLEPEPSFSICEMVWLRAFGPALENMLLPECVGNRLELRGVPPEVPIEGRSAFRYWAREYQRFRTRALGVAQQCLETEKRRCVLTTLDLASYYDSIDPSFLVRRAFVDSVEQHARRGGVRFERRSYLAATEGLLDAFARFRHIVAKKVGINRSIGIPIGSLTSRVIANLALAELDRHIANQPQVRYYARYVDDILVVEVPDSDVEEGHQTAVARLLPLVKSRSDSTQYTLDSRKLNRVGCEFVVQSKKLRVFDLVGESGLEYLGSVEAELRRVSSERMRFLEPWTEDFDRTVQATPTGEPVRALREAHALSLRRLAVGIVSDKVATAAAMLPRDEAREFSRKHLGRAGLIATDWSRWVDLIDVALRLLGSALMSGDIDTANEIIESLLERAASLGEGHGAGFVVRWCDTEIPDASARGMIRRWVQEQVLEVVCGATPFNEEGFLVEGVKAIDGGFRRGRERLTKGDLLVLARKLSASDLRLADRETDWTIGTAVCLRDPNTSLPWKIDQDIEYQRRVAGIDSFLEVCIQLQDAAFAGMRGLDILLMPRPPSYGDVMMRWLRGRRPVDHMLDVLNAVRGTRYESLPMRRHGDELIIQPPSPSPTAEGPGEVGQTRIVLGNLCSELSWWSSSLTSVDTSGERQDRVTRVFNAAMDCARRAKGRPTMLVLPELSIPRRWAREIWEHLARTETSLTVVMGVEYQVVGKSVYNEAVMYLPRPRRSAAGWIWTKRRPARHENAELISRGFQFATRGEDDRFVVVSSEHGRFLALICSELLEVDTRAEVLRRGVELVLVPAWNTDTTSFEYLVHAAALELHGFIAVANNGTYSDCRIRGPYAVSWQRDVCRLISRGENEVVSADVPIEHLRAYRIDPSGYESRRKAWIAHEKNTKKTTPPNPCPMPEWKPAPPNDDWRDS